MYILRYLPMSDAAGAGGATTQVARQDITDRLAPRDTTGQRSRGAASRWVARSRQLEALSPYQRRVLQLMATGMSNVAIAEELGVSRRAIENQVSRLMQALGLSRENDAVSARVCAVLVYLSETTASTAYALRSIGDLGTRIGA
jgi:DNA-binding NarL/FixJ family response regulator